MHIYFFIIIGKTKLAPLVPALIHDFLLNDERGTPLRVEVSVVNITVWTFSLSSCGAEMKNTVTEILNMAVLG